MNRATINLLMDKTFATIKHLSDNKGHEYSGDKDALSNFKRNGQMLGLDPLQIWAVYFSKHHDSLMTYIKEIPDEIHRVLTEPIEGRIDDMITYLILAKALIRDKDPIYSLSKNEQAELNEFITQVSKGKATGREVSKDEAAGREIL